MSANFENKKLVVDEIKQKLGEAKTIVMVDYIGSNVAQDTALRANIRKESCEYKVYKNRLVLRALNELGLTGYDEYLNGTTAIAFSSESETAPAKVVYEASKDNTNLKIKCGIMNGQMLDVKQVEELASIPSKEVLIAQLLGLLQSPIRGLACALNEIAKK